MIFRNKAKERAIRMGQYQQMVELLAEEFDWGDDGITKQSLLNVLTRRDGEFDNTFEYILDYPSMAQFRLRWHKEDGFRVAYYPFSSINYQREARAERLTQRLQEIQNG
jgi:hypothetical protein